jgi:hypothetical protein
MRTRDKCYVIKDKKTKRLQGAFPYTKEGKAKAKKYLKKINGDKNFEILEQ